MASLLCVAFAVGCAAPVATPAAPKPTPIAPALDLRADPSGPPIVAVDIDGLPVDMLVDTGADVHILLQFAMELAGGTAIPLEHTRATQVDGVHVGLGERELDHVIEAHAMPVLTERRLGGVISPLRWARDGVRIDLVHGKLSFGAAPPLAGAPTFTGRLVKCVARDFIAPRPVVEVEVDGHAALLDVDTGSSRTVLLAKSAIGQRFADQGSSIVLDLAFRKADARSVEGVTLRAGSLRRVIAPTILDGEPLACEPTEGTLGMDMLSGCVLDVLGETLTAHCQDAPVTLPPPMPAADRIRIAAVEIEPACGVDAIALARAAHPTSPWRFRDWAEVGAALTALAAGDDDLAHASNMVHASCRERGATEPDYRLHWRPTPEGLVLRYVWDRAAETRST